jgi:dTDP-4-dehydrorhamnose reductase
MRILILGGDGMMGHQLLAVLKERHDVKVTLRQPLQSYASFGIFDEANAFDNIDVRSLERLTEVMASFRPDAVVNCVGIVKQRATSKDAIPSLEINALLPHRLAVLCRMAGARLIHMSTDCVFSGRGGTYAENHPSDAEDLYGRSKYLGEVSESHCLTLRTSIIGHELSRKTSLLEWVLAQKGTVKGFRRAIFSGFTTLELSRIIERLLVSFPAASGLYQVSSDPIDKYALVQLIKTHLHPGIEVVPDDALVIDRSLDSSRFRADFGYTPPAWPEMIKELSSLQHAHAARN